MAEARGKGRTLAPAAPTLTFRAHARRAVRVRALLTHIDEGVQRHVEVIDLGLGGAAILLSEADLVRGAEPILATGEAVTLSFIAPTLWDPLVVRGHVAWAKKRAAGIAFEHRNAAATLALFELVNASSTR